MGKCVAASVRVLRQFVAGMERLTESERMANIKWAYDYFVLAPIEAGRRAMAAKWQLEREKRAAETAEFFAGETKMVRQGSTTAPEASAPPDKAHLAGTVYEKGGQSAGDPRGQLA